MPDPLLRTKLFIPQLQPNLVPRPQLIRRLNQGLQSGNKLTLVSAPAGFGKMTLVNDWVRDLQSDVVPEGKKRIAWLSMASWQKSSILGGCSPQSA